MNSNDCNSVELDLLQSQEDIRLSEMFKKDSTQGGLGSSMMGGLKQALGIDDQNLANAKRMESYLQPGLHIDEQAF